MNRLKEDIITGKISYMRLIDTDTSVLKENKQAMIFNTWRSVSSRQGDYFSLKTQRCNDGTPLNVWEDCEAYYIAFNYYDGKILKAGKTVYECM